jgi:hypothetical protein
MNEIETLLKAAHAQIEEIVREENFGAYQDVKTAIENSIDLIKMQEMEKCKQRIFFSIRMIMEAPPRNSELGLALLQKLDVISDKLSN